MAERFHATVKIAGWRIEEGKDVDVLIQKTLSDMAKLHGGNIRLIDFKVYEIETKPLPPHRDTFLTVIAEEVA